MGSGGTSRRRAWAPVVVLACAGLVALVAVVADGAPLRAPRGDDAALVDDDVAAAVLLVVAGLGVAILVYSVASARRRPAPAVAVVRRNPWVRSLLMIGAFVALALALSVIDDDAGEPEAPETTPVTVDGGGGEGRGGAGGAGPVAGLVVGVAVLLGIAALLRRQGPLPDVAEAPEPPPVAMTEAIDRSLGALDDPDPRAAVQAAYRHLLAALDDVDLGRRPSEAPHEHLRRALAAVAVPAEPLEELVALYDEARFSEHQLTDEHRRRARRAFTAARDDLAVVDR